MMFEFPILYSINKNNKELWWRITALEDWVCVEKGQTNGKTTTYEPVRCYGKNIGKKNETTAHEQAISEARSKWNKKLSAGYFSKEGGAKTDHTETTSDSDHESLMVLPMLANKFTNKTTYPVFVSHKLDGIRCLSTKTKHDNIILWSRTKHLFPNFNTIREQLSVLFESLPNMMLDGELYSHEIPFNELSGIIRRKHNKSEYEEKVEYHIFDIVDIHTPYTQRLDVLRSIQKLIYEHKLVNLKIVDSDIANNIDEVNEYHTKSIQDGYEGVMIRTFDGKYTLKSRSNALLKLKHFEDTEFKVVDVMAAKGTEEGGVIFVCELENGERFNVRPRGTIEKRRWQYVNKDLYIGKMLTVRWQETPGSNIPRFGTGIAFDNATEMLTPVDFRDYE